MIPCGLKDSTGQCEGSEVGVWGAPELATARLADTEVVDTGVGSGSTRPFALSFKGGATAGRSATDSSTVDNFCGARLLWEMASLMALLTCS